MRNIIFIHVLFLLISVGVFSQNTDYNYILTRTMVDATGNKYNEKIDYINGIGRCVQTVLKKASPLKQDIVTRQNYDALGKKRSLWLPIPMGGKQEDEGASPGDDPESNGIVEGTGNYVDMASFKSSANSFYEDNAPYSTPVYKNLLLNMVSEEYGPGAEWRTNNRSVKTENLTNTSSGNLSCSFYEIVGDNLLHKKGMYGQGELFVTKITDEDNKVSFSFINQLGQKILTRQINKGQAYDTYFVYDDFGDLRYILPPAASDKLTDNALWNIGNSEVLKNYAYFYIYNERGNCVFKKLPGCAPIYMRYDKADRLIFSQDGNQRGKEWTFFLYDVFGRQTVSGICKSSTMPKIENIVVETYYTGSGMFDGYNINIPLRDFEILTVNYYDNYSFINKLTEREKSKLPFFAMPGYNSQYLDSKGLLTGTKIYQLNDNTKYTVSAIYYNDRGQVIQKHESNHLGGFDDNYFSYSFTDKLKKRKHISSATGKPTLTEEYKYQYDHAERLLSVKHKVNSSPDVVLVQNTYDEVGRLKTKTLANKTSSYSYNVRSWITQITGPLFNQTLTYNKAINNVNPAIKTYNGNISAIKWELPYENIQRGYKFAYDDLNRLTFANYGEGNSLNNNVNRYNEAVTSYDKMGNILKLKRYGKYDYGYGLIDNLTYTYRGNRLIKVQDASNLSVTYYGAFQFKDGANADVEYIYDKNGNLIKDYNKKIVEIKYNSLNLPQSLQFTNGNSIDYIYNANGDKLSVKYKTAKSGVVIPMTNIMTPLTPDNILFTSKTDYCGNIIYEDGKISKILTEEGYITFSGSSPVYHYYFRDHQGNNRIVINQNGGLDQINHYYPFGGVFGIGVQNQKQPYKYNGKELDRMHGLDLYDYGARHYDAALARWITPDPLAEKYVNISSYTYTTNNPILFVDKDGKKIYIITENKKVIKGTKILQKTTIGKHLWDKYGRNDNHDIYISAQSFRENHGGGLTYAYANRLGMIKNGKVDVTQFYSSAAYTRDFSSFNGLDVSKSEGKNIHLVSINTETIGEDGTLGKYKFNGAAYKIFHEIDAHIEKYTSGDAKAEHKKHGYEIVTKEINGQKVQAISIKKGSDAWKIMIELIKYGIKKEGKYEENQ